MGIVNVYKPIWQHPGDEEECIYEEIKELNKRIKGYENRIIMGDRNARVGDGKVDCEHG